MIDLTFKPGDIVRVHQKIKEGDRQRSQVFEGTVLAIRGRGENKTFMVRKVAGGIAVERIWPVASPLLEKVVLKEHPKRRPRRAKLFFLRNIVH